MTTMKAWRSSAYGEGGNPADAIGKLVCSDVAVPEPAAGQVQIKVNFAAVNPIDWKLFSGGLHGIVPCAHPYTPGFDIAGTISKIGDGVTGFAVGDSVCGDIGLVETCTDPPPAVGNCGAFAEFAVVPTSIITKTLGVEESSAAAVPLAGLTALQALFTKSGRTFTGENLGNVKAGDKLLVLGGATLVGALAIQLAKNVGAVVACTASTNAMPDGTTKMDYCKSLGATEVIDYKTTKWAEVLAGKDYDMIFDTVGAQEDWADAFKVLKKGSDFISVANFGPDMEANKESKFKNFLLKSVDTDLAELVAMLKDGTLKVPVDSVVPFADVPAALTKSFSSANAGKIVIKVA